MGSNTRLCRKFIISCKRADDCLLLSYRHDGDPTGGHNYDCLASDVGLGGCGMGVVYEAGDLSAAASQEKSLSLQQRHQPS
jgi:hypothetical protein